MKYSQCDCTRTRHNVLLYSEKKNITFDILTLMQKNQYISQLDIALAFTIRIMRN